MKGSTYSLVIASDVGCTILSGDVCVSGKHNFMLGPVHSGPLMHSLSHNHTD